MKASTATAAATQAQGREHRRHQPIETEGLSDQRGCRRPAGAASGDMPLLVDKLHADDSDCLVRRVGEESRRSFEAASGQSRIRIEEQKVIRARSRGALVARRCKTPVFRIADELCGRVAGREAIGGTVPRRVVDD